MPTDLFQPMAGVQTSIYIFEVNKPHDYEQTLNLLILEMMDINEQMSFYKKYNPTKRYQDIIKIYKAGRNAKVDFWNLDEDIHKDFITPKWC